MDINGAKALKKRLGPNGADEAPPVSADVPADAPPVYHWLGVSKGASDAPAPEADDEPIAPSASLFRRFGLTFR
jgi:hypothetical protein